MREIDERDCQHGLADTEQDAIERAKYRFRLLRPGERIMRGDECLNDDCETWSEVSAIVLRCDYNPAVFVPHRRPTPNE